MTGRQPHDLVFGQYEVGRCSRPTVRPGRNVNDERDHGDGSDTRPRGRRTSGSLTETRVRDWQYWRERFDGSADQNTNPCSLDGTDQLARHVLAACVKPDGPVDADGDQARVIDDASHPAFLPGGEAARILLLHGQVDSRQHVVDGHSSQGRTPRLSERFDAQDFVQVRLAQEAAIDRNVLTPVRPKCLGLHGPIRGDIDREVHPRLETQDRRARHLPRKNRRGPQEALHQVRGGRLGCPTRIGRRRHGIHREPRNRHMVGMTVHAVRIECDHHMRSVATDECDQLAANLIDRRLCESRVLIVQQVYL